MLIILVNFIAKYDLIQSAAKQGSILNINECLTKKREFILNRLHQIHKQNPNLLKQFYARNGTIIGKKEHVKDM